MYDYDLLTEWFKNFNILNFIYGRLDFNQINEKLIFIIIFIIINKIEIHIIYVHKTYNIY